MTTILYIKDHHLLTLKDPLTSRMRTPTRLVLLFAVSKCSASNYAYDPSRLTLLYYSQGLTSTLYRHAGVLFYTELYDL